MEEQEEEERQERVKEEEDRKKEVKQEQTDQANKRSQFRQEKSEAPASGPPRKWKGEKEIEEEEGVQRGEKEAGGEDQEEEVALEGKAKRKHGMGSGIQRQTRIDQHMKVKKRRAHFQPND